MSEPRRDPDAWIAAWERSKRLQRALRAQSTPEYYVQAQSEHDFCQAVQDSPPGAGPSAKAWFRDEDVPLSDAGTVQNPERSHDLHVVRPPDSITDRAATSAAVTRWQAIAKDRGGSYSAQVKTHAWAALYLVVGVIIGALSTGYLCR